MSTEDTNNKDNNKKSDKKGRKGKSSIEDITELVYKGIRSVNVKLILDSYQKVLVKSLILSFHKIASDINQEAMLKFQSLAKGKIYDLDTLNQIKGDFKKWFSEYFKEKRKIITDTLGSVVSDTMSVFLLGIYDNFFANYKNYLLKKVEGEPSFPNIPYIFQVRERGFEVDYNKRIITLKLKPYRDVQLKFFYGSFDNISHIIKYKRGFLTINEGLNGSYYAHISYSKEKKVRKKKAQVKANEVKE
uniref:Uncharacterized protein n=1 Tax=Saccharolobus islandicus TaxID=43080 RepID=Q5W2Y8_SACIS|nr:hypothetical protein [Sulfolobus islandicus]CAG38158.1 hypothetical protein [Sulfolobus islandicus]